MPVIHNGAYDSPSTLDLYQQQTPVLNRKQVTDRTTNKRPRSNISPPDHQQTETRQQIKSTQHPMTHTTTNSKILFPPVIVKFNGEQ